MTTLVHAALAIRRTARISLGPIAGVIFGLVVSLGVFSIPVEQLGLEQLAVAVAWLAVLISRGSARFKDRTSPTLDLEIGILLLTATHAAVQLGGGLTSELYPVVCIVVAFLTAFAKKPAGVLLVVSAIALEALLYFVTESQTNVTTFLAHASFLALFGSLNLLFTRMELLRAREASKRELDAVKQRAEDDARLFRLVSPASGRQTDDERRTRSSLQEVHNALFHMLDMLKKTLELHTCVLIFVDDSGSGLRIVELATDSNSIKDGPFARGEGAVGAVLSRGRVTNLEHIKQGYNGLCYYTEPALVSSFIGVPVEENGRVVGALCADRLDDRPFTDREEEILNGAVHQCLRTLQNERLFVQLEQSKGEQTVLYEASQALGAALTEDAVMRAGLEAAEKIAKFDFAAITFYESEEKRHVVRRAVGANADTFANLSFRDNTSLTAMVVKNKHYLPYRGEFDEKQQVVFTRRANLKGMNSLLIMPLVVREEAIGTMALAATRESAFGDTVRPMLEVLTNHVAVSLANAAAVRRLEEMATTDGLTGCLNKRSFLEEMDRKVRAAERFGRPLSLLVTDIDHFKAVNDTYGHATGDVVIRELGAILKRMKRETDIVARFGGEEFCVLCEETDTDGALLLANRIREELHATIFQTEIGKLNVRASIGVATFPRDANNAGELFEVTDQALYAAKRGGRDMVCTAGAA